MIGRSLHFGGRVSRKNDDAQEQCVSLERKGGIPLGMPPFLMLCWLPMESSKHIQPFVRDPSIPDMKEGDAIPVTYIEPIASAKLIERGVPEAPAAVARKIDAGRFETVEDVFGALGIE